MLVVSVVGSFIGACPTRGSLTLPLEPGDAVVSLLSPYSIQLAEVPFLQIRLISLPWFVVPPEGSPPVRLQYVLRAIPSLSLLPRWVISCAVPPLGEQLGDDDLVYY